MEKVGSCNNRGAARFLKLGGSGVAGHIQSSSRGSSGGHRLVMKPLLRFIKLRELSERSIHFFQGDQFINSHNLLSSQCMDIVRSRNLGGWGGGGALQW